MKNHNHIKSIIAACLLGLSACSQQEEAKQPDAAPAVQSVPATAPDVVAFSEAQQQVAGIVLGSIEDRKLSSRVPANGQIQLPPQNMASVNPLIGGVVRSIPVKEGAYVNKGTVLATIENPELIRLQEDYLTTRNQLKFAKLDYDRQRTLNQEQVGSRKKYEQTETDVQVQRARLKALATQLTSFGISPKRVESGSITATMAITAPISGYIREIAVNIGTYAQPGQPMFELVDNHHLHLELNVFEKDFQKLEEGQQVQFSLPNVSGKPLQATAFALGKAFEGDSRMVSVHAEMVNNTDKKLLPGMYVNAHIMAGEQQLPALPEEAIVRYKNQHYIFLKESPATFKMAQVSPGVSEQGYTEVKPVKDLPAKAQIVTKGAYFILAEKMKSETAEE